MYVIYALIDPRDYRVRYVGLTTDVYKRFVEHISCSGVNYDKNAWIMELRTINKMVIMETLEEVNTRSEAEEREGYWIQHFERMLEPIVNISKTIVARRANRTNLRVSEAMRPVEVAPAQVSGTVEVTEAELPKIVLGKDCSVTLEAYAVALQLRKSKKINGYRGLMEPFGLSEHHAKELNRRITQEIASQKPSKRVG